jgi:hypothetical protein
MSVWRKRKKTGIIHKFEDGEVAKILSGDRAKSVCGSEFPPFSTTSAPANPENQFCKICEMLTAK